MKNAVFWCKKTNFKALKKDEPFFFLERGKFESNADRYIVGYGNFQGFQRLQYTDAWKKFNTKLGFDTKEKFEACIMNIYHGEISDIGCIALSNVHFYDIKRFLEDCYIDFSPYIVSGKKINSDECERIERCKG